jgi:hypothetical protein
VLGVGWDAIAGADVAATPRKPIDEVLSIFAHRVRIVRKPKDSERTTGVGYLPVLESADGDRLWIIEDGPGGDCVLAIADFDVCRSW